MVSFWDSQHLPESDPASFTPRGFEGWELNPTDPVTTDQSCFKAAALWGFPTFGVPLLGLASARLGKGAF